MSHLWRTRTSFLQFYSMARFYATTEQKIIHSFWNALRIRRKINQFSVPARNWKWRGATLKKGHFSVSKTMKKGTIVIFSYLILKLSFSTTLNYTKVRVIHRPYTTLHKTILGFADIGSMEKFFLFFLYRPSYK